MLDSSCRLTTGREVVCEVTESERDAIERLHERQTSLRNLLRRVEEMAGEPGGFHGIDPEAVRRDFGDNIRSMQKWWAGTLQKFGLPFGQQDIYYIDFAAREISRSLGAAGTTAAES